MYGRLEEHLLTVDGARELFRFRDQLCSGFLSANKTGSLKSRGPFELEKSPYANGPLRVRVTKTTPKTGFLEVGAPKNGREALSKSTPISLFRERPSAALSVLSGRPQGDVLAVLEPTPRIYELHHHSGLLGAERPESLCEFLVKLDMPFTDVESPILWIRFATLLRTHGRFHTNEPFKGRRPRRHVAHPAHKGPPL